jgi:hypothetical protein
MKVPTLVRGWTSQNAGSMTATAKSCLDGVPKRIGIVLPEMRSGAQQFLATFCAEHLDGPFVGFLEDERLHGATQEAGTQIQMRVQVRNPPLRQ